MRDAAVAKPPLLVLAEFVFSEAGEAEFLVHRDRTMDETGPDACSKCGAALETPGDV